MPHLLRTAFTCLAALFALAAEAAPANGVIVQLRDAPPHVAMGAKRALAAQRDAQPARWRALLADPRLAGESRLTLHPAGRAAQRLDVGRPLSSGEAERLAAHLAARPDVEWAEPNTLEERLQVDLPVPDDPFFSGAEGQWWLGLPGGANGNAIEARRRGVPGVQRAWSRGARTSEVVVAVLDTGITAHPDLDPARLLPGYDMVDDWDAAAGRGYANDGDGRDADPSDPGDAVTAADRAADPGRYADCALQSSSWHGSTVTGLIAATTGNGIGGAGIVWSGPVLPVRVAGKCGGSLGDIVDGLRWAAGLEVCKRFRDAADPTAGCAEWAPRNPRPARVVNVSFGGAMACGRAYQDAIDELRALGIVVVAAAGNGHGAVARPANCRGVVAVAALNRDGFKTHYSNFGPQVTLATVGGDDGGGRWGGLLADGGLLSIANVGQEAPAGAAYARYFGTSFAAPIVSATLALMRSEAPQASVDEIVAALQESTRPHVASKRIGACSATNPGRCICSSATCGAGILDAGEAIVAARSLAAHEAYGRPAWPIEWVSGVEIESAQALGPDVGAESPSTPAAEPDSSGGGAVDAGTLAGLLSAAAALAWMRRRPQRMRPALAQTPRRQAPSMRKPQR